MIRTREFSVFMRNSERIQMKVENLVVAMQDILRTDV